MRRKIFKGSFKKTSVAVVATAYFLTSCGLQEASDMKKVGNPSAPQTMNLADEEFGPDFGPDSVAGLGSLEADLAVIDQDLTKTIGGEPPQVSPEALARRPKPVKFTDIASWKPVGSSYAAGYDANGNLLAIYDLSFQNTHSGAFIGRSILGTIGAGDLNLATIIKWIRKAIKDHKSQSIAGETSDIDSLVAGTKALKTDMTLSRISRQYGSVQSPFQGDWMAKIPLKKNAMMMQDENGGSTFKLSDVDFQNIMTPSKFATFNASLAKITSVFNEQFDMDMDLNLLEQIAVTKNADGSMTVALAQSAAQKDTDKNRPMKIIDFMRYRATFGDALLQLLLEEGLKGAAGAIPEPVIAGVLKYSISRWFSLYKEQQSFHRFRALEYVNLAERGQKSPFAFLSDDQRSKAGVFVLSNDAEIYSFIFSKIDDTYWLKSIASENQAMITDAQWAQKYHWNIQNLVGYNFYSGTNSLKPNKNQVFAMGSLQRFAKHPYTVLNYAKPNDERIKRNFLGTLDNILSAISLPIMGADKILHLLYDVFVMYDIRQSEHWEARLVSDLHEFDGDKSKDYSKEIQILYDQRVNPFEFDVQEEQDFIKASQAYLGL